MRHENNRIDPARADELAREILYGKLPAAEVLRFAGGIDGKTVAPQDNAIRGAAFRAMQRGAARRAENYQEQQENEQAALPENPKRTSRRTHF